MTLKRRQFKYECVLSVGMVVRFGTDKGKVRPRGRRDANARRDVKVTWDLDVWQLTN
jgi:hypothetical protein